jgi:hypothetical protein
MINKEKQFSTTHIYKHNNLSNKNESDEVKLVCHISSNLLKTLELDWYEMREEPNNTVNTVMNTSMPQ